MFLATHGVLRRSSGFVPPVFTDIYYFQFDGVTDYFTVDSPVTFTGNFSVSFWTQYSGGNYKAIFGGTSGSVGGMLESLVMVQGALYYRDTSSSWTKININSIVGLGWVNFALTYDSSLNEFKTYQNGTLQTTKNPSSFSSKGNSGIYQIGRRSTGSYYNSSLNEISSYDYVLSQSEVTSISAGPSDLTSLYPTQWFRMGEHSVWNGSAWVMTSQGSDTGTATSSGFTQSGNPSLH